MSMDFPVPTAVGHRYVSGTGPTYEWDGLAWNIVKAINLVFVSDTPPSNPAPGQQWWRTTNCQMYVWYDDGTSQQWVQSAGAAGSSGLWEPVGPGIFTLNADTQKVITDVGAYRRFRFSGGFTPSVSAYIAFQFSQDNGATWIGGAASYAYQRGLVSGTTYTGGAANLNSWALSASSDANLRAPFWGTIEEFNQASASPIGVSKAGGWASSNMQMIDYFQRANFNGPCNALKLIPSAGTLTGSFTLEGVRG